MGYAVDYTPTWERAKRRKGERQPRPVASKARRMNPKNRAQRMKDLRNTVRWNVRRLEHDTISTDNIRRKDVIRYLHLDKIAPDADPSGDQAMQQLISEGIVPKSVSRAGVDVFDRDVLITSLKAWAGVK